MYVIEKRSTVLENAAGLTRLDAYGVCLYIGETNFAFLQMLYKSKCHQR